MTVSFLTPEDYPPLMAGSGPSAPAAPATPLKYSDYCAGAAIVSASIGTSAWLLANHPEIGAIFGVVTGALTALSQWLQSKGD